MSRLRRTLAATALVSITAVVAAGCGGEKTDVSGGVDNLNERLTQQGIPAKLDCPKEVDGGEGTEFDCTLKANEGGKEEKLKMEVQKEGDDLVVDVKDQAAFEKALQSVAGQQGGGQGGEEQQGGAQGGEEQQGE
ncbi:MAG: hypothetical protein M3340_12575 [Actinomycetota bacterium]|nr:hypothetical protein [Actinomycetota bacterium]